MDKRDTPKKTDQGTTDETQNADHHDHPTRERVTHSPDDTSYGGISHEIAPYERLAREHRDDRDDRKENHSPEHVEHRSEQAPTHANHSKEHSAHGEHREKHDHHEQNDHSEQASHQKDHGQRNEHSQPKHSGGSSSRASSHTQKKEEPKKPFHWKDVPQFFKNSYRSLRESIQKAPPPLRKGAFWILILAMLLVIVLGAIKVISHVRETNRLEAELKAGPHVRVISVTKTPGEHLVSVIGEALPFSTVTLYAKVSGYLRDITVDKGDVVKKNQILAKIESPETDQQYQGAFSDAKNKRAIAGRMRILLKKQLVSPQEAETAFADSEIADARLSSARTLKGYEVITAPFNGTVTSRFVDPGALVQNATNAQTGALPIVTISQIDQLRVYLYLDQRDATFVQVGAEATVTVPERPGFEIAGRVNRVSGELDPKTRMLLTEVDLDNTKGDLVAGSFVQVSLQIKTPSLLEVPVEALVEQQGKSMVGVITGDQTVHYKEVKIANNDGKSVTLLSGVEPGEKVGLSLGSAVHEGGKVRPEEDAPAKTAPAAAPDASPAKTSGGEGSGGAGGAGNSNAGGSAPAQKPAAGEKH